jgi:phage host-nuclease inhibitor protein Gam
MARKTLKTLDHCNAALERLGTINRALEEGNRDLEQAIAELRRARLDDAAPLIRERERLEEQLRDYLQDHEGDFEKKKSVELAFGKMGFRRSEAVELAEGLTMDDVVLLARERGHEDLVRVKTVESIDKRAAAALQDEQLVEIGCQRRVSNSPYFQAK